MPKSLLRSRKSPGLKPGLRAQFTNHQVSLNRICMERPMELSFWKFRNGDTCPGRTLEPLLMARAGTVMKLMVLVALNMSTRYSKLLRSLILNDLAMDKSRLL